MNLNNILRKLLINDISLKIFSTFLNKKYFIKSQDNLHANVIEAKEWEKLSYKVNNLIRNIHPKFYLASNVAKGVFSPINEMPFPSDLKYLEKELPLLNSLASCGSSLFPFIGFGKFLSWFARWASIISKVDTEIPTQVKKVDTFVEFGPGLGLDPIYLNLLNKNAKVKLYDLPSMIKMQKNVHQYWNNEGFAIDTSKYEYYSDLENLIRSIQKNEIVDFYAFWSFSESPLELRELFHNFFKLCNKIIIVSNRKMFNIDNTKYFNKLAKILEETHDYKSLDLPIYNLKKSYMDKHSINCYYRKSI